MENPRSIIPSNYNTPKEVYAFLCEGQNLESVAMRMKWAGGIPICPACGADGFRLQADRRAIFSCKYRACKKQFSIKSGTVMENSSVPLIKWVVAMWWVGGKGVVSIRDMARFLDVSKGTAYRTLRLIENTLGTKVMVPQKGEWAKEHTPEYIVALIKSLVENEDKRRPLSDRRIQQEIYVRYKISILRRSIAQWRKRNDIPAARYRKILI